MPELLAGAGAGAGAGERDVRLFFFRASRPSGHRGQDVNVSSVSACRRARLFSGAPVPDCRPCAVEKKRIVDHQASGYGYERTHAREMTP